MEIVYENSLVVWMNWIYTEITTLKILYRARLRGRLRQWNCKLKAIKDNGCIDECHVDTVRDYLDFFNSEMKNRIIDKLSRRKCLDDKDKIGLECLSKSISIIHQMERNINDLAIFNLLNHLLHYLDVFGKYFQENEEVKTIIEIMLCGLSTCMERLKEQKARTDNLLLGHQKTCLELYFINPNSDKIKMAAAMILSESGAKTKGFLDIVRDYLREVGEKLSENKYLGMNVRWCLDSLLPDEKKILKEENEKLKKDIAEKDKQIAELLQESNQSQKYEDLKMNISTNYMEDGSQDNRIQDENVNSSQTADFARKV